jgi:hypothetical protein
MTVICGCGNGVGVLKTDGNIPSEPILHPDRSVENRISVIQRSRFILHLI